MHWLARGEPHLPEVEDWLTPEEAARAARMRFAKRRSEYLVRRLTAKHAVSVALGRPTDPVSLAGVAVRNHPTGAPFVEVDGAPLGIDISLTDRAGWGVCLVGQDLGAVGCDLEIVEPRTPGFVSDFLTPAERDVVRRAGADRGDVLANLIWSAKESALKVLRTGLRRDTWTVEVALDDPDAPEGTWTRLTVRADGARDFPGWWVREGVWLLTVAYDGPGPVPQGWERPSPLASATPTHSWVGRPVVGQPSGTAIPRSRASTM